MKLVIPLLLLFVTVSAYPIPVDCVHAPHAPTIDVPVTQSFGHAGHVGIDYTLSVGTPVYAVMDGIVIQVIGDSRVYGRFISALHCDGYMSMYAHLSKILVKFGEVVQAGQLIGLSGGYPGDNIDGDGWSSGAHLHFEIRVPGHLENNKYNIDPAQYFDLAERQLPMEME